MKSADVLKQIVPPTQVRVKAGVVVYAPHTENRCIVILNEGELKAQEVEIPHKTIFTMHPGDLVGVASLLEREPFKYQLVASKDSLVTLITEESMESELKQIPLWMLAIIRSFASKTRDYKIASQKSNIQNPLQSLAEYLSHKKSKEYTSLQNLVLEYTFLSRLPAVEIAQAFNGLSRRHFIEIKKIKGEDCCKIHDTRLLEAFVDYQSTTSQGKLYPPYGLNKNQRKLLEVLAKNPNSTPREGADWVKFLGKIFPQANLSDWLILKNLGCFYEESKNIFVLDTKTVTKIYLALLFETNIRGVI